MSCQNLVKRYGATTAVAGISFEVKAGECFGLLGPNGAGKTTTMEMIEGLTQPDGGKVEILGQGWHPRTSRALRARMGVQLQQAELPDRLTALEAVTLYRSFYPRGPSVRELLALVSLQDKQSTWVSGLSMGQRQRLSLACALAGDPEVLFLDEPTTGLDPQARLSVWEVVERFTARGGTVLLTTHYMEEAERLCDRIGIVDRGQIIALDTPAALIERTLGGQRMTLELLHGRVSLDVLSALPCVSDVRLEQTSAALTTSDVGKTLAALTRQLEAHGDGLRAMTTHRATLEEAFVKLTGRALRDG